MALAGAEVAMDSEITEDGDWQDVLVEVDLGGVELVDDRFRFHGWPVGFVVHDEANERGGNGGSAFQAGLPSGIARTAVEALMTMNNQIRHAVCIPPERSLRLCV